MLLSKEKKLFTWFSVIMTIHMSMSINLAHAVFGQSDVPLEDYYHHGKSQTGVAVVNARKGERLDLGTANLVDVGVEALKGRVMITAAHMLEGMNTIGSSVRFMDENNNSSNMDIQATYFLESYRTDQKDIGFIVLANSVDTEKFKPLKLNLTQSNESLVGSDISIMGCSPMMGHAGSNLVVQEDHRSSLRRGMQTLLRYGSDTNPRMNYAFHHHAGFIEIKRNPEYALTAQALARKMEIETELKALESSITRNKETGIEDEELNIKYVKLWMDPQSCEREMTRNKFSQKLVCDEAFKNQLATLTGADDLDKEAVIKQWEDFISQTDESTKRPSIEKSFKLEKYDITMYNPLPLLSGINYHGDSGGAWIIGDEIVAISEAFASAKFHEFNEIPSCPAASSDLSRYFSSFEALLKNPSCCTTPLLNVDSPAVFGTSIWSCKNWVESTLQKIISDLNLI